MRKFILALLLMPSLALGQSLVNCMPNIPCTTAGAPAVANEGDKAWLAFGKINQNFNTLTPFFNYSLLQDFISTHGFFANGTTLPGASFASPGFIVDSLGNLDSNSLFVTGNMNVTTCFGNIATTSCTILGWNGSIAGGTSSGTYAPIIFNLNSDTFSDTSLNSLTAVVEIHRFIGGIGARGGSNGLYVTVEQNTKSNDQGGGYTAATFTGRTSVNNGGIPFHPMGSGFGTNPNVGIQCNSPPPGNGACATNFGQLIGTEIDIQSYANTTVEDKIGEQIVEQSNDAVSAQGGADEGFSLNSSQTASGWKIGYALGAHSGYWPMNAAGSIMGCYPHANIYPCGTTKNGINWQGITFTSYPYQSFNYSVDGSGNSSATAFQVGSGGISGQSATLSSITINSQSLWGSTISGGVYYNRSSFPPIVIGAPPSGGTQAVAAIATEKLNVATIVNPGVGVSNGDVLTLTGGAGTQATVTMVANSFTGHINGNQLIVSSSTGLAVGQILSDGSGNIIQGFSGTGSISGTTLTITAITYGTVQVNSRLLGGGSIAENSTVTALGTGTGGTGTYTLDRASTVGSTTIVGLPTYITGGGSNNSNWIVNIQQTVASESITATGVSITTPGSYTGVSATPGTTGGTASTQPTFNFGFGVASITVSNAGAGYLCNPLPLVYTNHVFFTDDFSADLTPVMSCSTTPATMADGIAMGGATFTVTSGTGACDTGGHRTSLTGGTNAGSLVCTGTTGASTIVLSLPAQLHGNTCYANDDTTGLPLGVGSNTTTAATISGTITSGDKIVFGCIGY